MSAIQPAGFAPWAAEMERNGFGCWTLPRYKSPDRDEDIDKASGWMCKVSGTDGSPSPATQTDDRACQQRIDYEALSYLHHDRRAGSTSQFRISTGPWLSRVEIRAPETWVRLSGAILTLRPFQRAAHEDIASSQLGFDGSGWGVDPKTGLWTFGTRSVGRRNSFDLWRVFNATGGTPTGLEAIRRHGADVRLSIMGAPGYSTFDLTASPHILVRDRSDIRCGTEDLALVLLLVGGTSIAEQHGRSISASPGDILVVFMDIPFKITQRETTSLTGSCLPASAFPPGLRDRSPLLLSPRFSSLAAIAAGHLRWNPTDPETFPHLSGLVRDQLVALLSRGLDMGGSRAEPSSNLSGAVRSMIEVEIANPNLSAKLLCTRLGVSRTTLFEALAANGDTLGSLVRERRLAGCRDEMMHASGTETLATISKRWGFRNPSTFTRAFSRRFGRPPTQWTRAMRDMGGDPLVGDEA